MVSEYCDHEFNVASGHTLRSFRSRLLLRSRAARSAGGETYGGGVDNPMEGVVCACNWNRTHPVG